MSSPIIFKDRTEAGKKLVGLLQEFKNTDAIILAIPRGGTVVAKEVSTALNLPLDIIVTRKIGAPENEECAIGAIDILGNAVWSEYEHINHDTRLIQNKIEAEKKEAIRRWETYRKGRGVLDLKNKTVIIIDDGIATGLTTRAAVEYTKHEGARRIVVAAPVASEDAVRALGNIADVRVFEIPPYFSAVGEWYEDFPQVSDQEVILGLAS